MEEHGKFCGGATDGFHGQLAHGVVSLPRMDRGFEREKERKRVGKEGARGIMGRGKKPSPFPEIPARSPFSSPVLQ